MANLGDVKVLPVVMPSGAGTSSGVIVGGYHAWALLIPTITSGLVSFIAPTPAGAFVPIMSITSGALAIGTVGQTGNCLVDGPAGWLAGYGQEVRISAGAAQAADRTFVWHWKG